MDTKQLRLILKDQNHSEIAKRTGVHRNLIARFVAGHDIKLSTADKLKAGVEQAAQPVTEEQGAQREAA